MLKFKTIKNVIYTDVKIINHTTGEIYTGVELSNFYILDNNEVIGIRTEENRVLISVK